MNEVNFVGEQSAPAQNAGGPKKGFAAFLVRRGMVKTEQQANVLLVVFAAIFLCAAWFLLANASRDTRADLPPISSPSL